MPLTQPQFRWLHMADVHFGCSHLDPYKLKYAIETTIFPYITRDLDLITIGGDWFDNALYMDNASAIVGSTVLSDICHLAKENDVTVRLLRGTFSHDRDQLKGISRVLSKIQGLDFKYYDVCNFDVIRSQLLFAYLPDNLNMHASEVYDWLANNYQDGVDCILVHGYFENALPTAVSLGKHLEAYNADILGPHVRYLIAAGHVHKCDCYKNIIYYPGSFDRLAHGEEEPKGCILFTLYPGYKHDAEYIQNHFATPHVTVYLTKEDVDEAVEEVERNIQDRFPTPLWGYLRIAGGPERLTVAKIIKSKYAGQLVVTDKDTTKKSENDPNGFDRPDIPFLAYTGKALTRDTLSTCIYQYLSDNISDFPMTEEQVEKALEELQAEK